MGNKNKKRNDIAGQHFIGRSFAQDDIDAPVLFENDAEEESEPIGSVFMQNRELSWLRFNERVLDQGADESVPLLERLNFISIFWSNLQEFFMVRVGSLTDLSYIEPPIIDSKTGMTPKEQIRAIHERCHELYPIQESYYEHVRGSLAKQGVRHLRPEDLSDEQRNYLFGLVRHNIEPFLSPQIINSRHPFPHIENGKLYILVRLDDEADEVERKKKKKDKEKGKSKKNKGAEGVLLGLIPLPHQCERVIKLPGRGFQFILLEHAIEMFVPEIFSMYKIKHTNVICVTRNADFDANQGFDEQDEDYREHMKRLLKQRARLAPVRLECQRPLSPVMEKLMLKKLALKRYQVYDTVVPLDLSFTWGLGSKLSESKRAKLSSEPFTPAWPTTFDRNRRIIDQVAEHESLIFYPFESMDPFVQLLREASTDPDVISIKITLYRLASQSHLAEALIAAADAGKDVTALFELRARFDENNNIEWSQRFEEAGCKVIYGFRDYKVHSKICCITRRMPDGSLQHITQLGTGNYNEKTARLYTDLSFITTDEAFGRDAVEFFRNMQLENVSDNYQVLRVAPLQIKPLILESLDKQIELAERGEPASAFLKANSITDKEVIEKIAEASTAGVKITLFIRGICCLIPQIKGATENVRVVSIVGRLLEHSRIYCFGSGDECEIYLSSADLMTRNLNKRVEIAWPVRDVNLKRKLLTYIDICMHDTAKLRELRANATYTPLGAFCDIDDDGNSRPAFDAQNALIEQAAEAAAITAAQEEHLQPAAVNGTDAVADETSPDEAQAIGAEDELERLLAKSLDDLPEPETKFEDEPGSPHYASYDLMAALETEDFEPEPAPEPVALGAEQLETELPFVDQAAQLQTDGSLIDFGQFQPVELPTIEDAQPAQADTSSLEAALSTGTEAIASQVSDIDSLLISDPQSSVPEGWIEIGAQDAPAQIDLAADAQGASSTLSAPSAEAAELSASSIQPDPVTSFDASAIASALPATGFDAAPATQSANAAFDSASSALPADSGLALGSPAIAEQPVDDVFNFDTPPIAAAQQSAFDAAPTHYVTNADTAPAQQGESYAFDTSVTQQAVELDFAASAGQAQQTPSVDFSAGSLQQQQAPLVGEAPAVSAEQSAPAVSEPAPDPAERVAELINQLGSVPEQHVEQSFDVLTEMKIGEIIPTEDIPAASAQQTFDSAGQPSQGPTISTVASNAPADAQAQTPSADSPESDDFFSEKNRDIEMPAEKKRGIFGKLLKR